MNILSGFTYAFLLSDFARAQHTMSSNGIILEVKASSSVTLPQVLIKDLYLPAEISLRSESLQILIGIYSYMCLYLLSTTVSTDSGYTLETAINFQSSLDTSLLLQTSRDLSVSDSHTLCQRAVLLWKQTLRVVAEHCRWRMGPFCWQSCPGVVWWSEWYPQVLSLLFCTQASYCVAMLYTISNGSDLSGFCFYL